jgi:hypothetical protein
MNQLPQFLYGLKRWASMEHWMAIGTYKRQVAKLGIHCAFGFTPLRHNTALLENYRYISTICRAQIFDSCLVVLRNLNFFRDVQKLIWKLEYYFTLYIRHRRYTELDKIYNMNKYCEGE